MIYLLYGEDTRRARFALRNFEDRFRREVAHSWRRIDCANEQDITLLKESAGSSDLFAGKQYYSILHPTLLPEALSGVLESLLIIWSKDDSVVVFFEEGEPKKNLLFSHIEKHATKTQKFSILDRTGVGRWIDAEVERRGVAVSAGSKKILLDAYDGDLWHLETEFERVIAGGTLEKRVYTPADSELFALGDLWGRRERTRALLKYDELLRSGFASERMMWTMLWHIRSLFLAFTKDTKGMSPYVVRKATEQARNFTLHDLEDAYRTLVVLDVRDKQGEVALDLGLLHFFLTR